MSTYTLYVNKSGPVQDVSVHAAATERLLMSLQAPGRRVVTDVVDFPSQGLSGVASSAWTNK